MRKFICSVLAAVLLLSLIPLGGASTALAATDYSNVRVLLSIGSTKTLTIPVSGSYFIDENGASFKNGTLTVKASGSKLIVSHSSEGELYTGSTVQIMRESISPSAGYFRLATSNVTRTFLGHLTLKCSGGFIRAINVVPLPHYLYGVVAYEMSDTFPSEALKAQAVAAKCYVLANMTGGSDYDIGDTAADQVYKGYNSSYSNVIRAVDATYDVGLFLGSKILCSYFAASNGGKTILPSDSWSGSNRYTWDKAYARVDDPYDVANPFSVQESISIPEDGENDRISAALSNYLRGRAAKVLRESGNIGPTDSVVFVQSVDKLKSLSDSTANIEMTVVVQLADGSQQEISLDYSFNLEEFVWNGVMTLPQTLRLYTVSENSKGYVVTRGRYGHGVGLSQRGAQQMANSGWKFDKILKFYYPGASIKSMGIDAPVDPIKPADPNAGTDTDNIGTPIGTYVTTDNINFRAEASASSTKLGAIPKGTSLSVFRHESNGFSLVLYNSTVGYVSSSYLKETAADTPVDPDSGGKTIAAYGEVTSSTLNLREKANTSGRILARLVKGNKIDIYGYVQDSTWYYCSYNGTEGYVSAQYIKLTGTPSSGTDTDPGAEPTPDPGTSTPVTTGSNGVIIVNGVNLRTNPSTSRGTVVAKLEVNTKVVIISDAGDYYGVTTGSKEGYVLKTYVRVTANSPTDTTGGTPTVQGYGVTTAAVNLRKGAGTGYSIITKLAKGAQLTIYESANNWYYVSVNGKTGYVSGDYVKQTQTATSDSGSSGSTDTSGTGKTWSGQVVNEYVRMRSSTDLATQNNIIGTYQVGTKVTILAQSGSFYLVIADGKQGYMHKDYVQITGENTASTNTGVTTANVYLRSSASSTAKILTTLSKGTTISILGSSGDYYQAQTGSYTGYLVKKYVTVQ